MRLEISRVTLAMIGVVSTGIACAGEAGEEPEPQFDCSSMEGTPGLVFCDDFNDGLAEDWLPEGGSWSVREGRYFGSGPDTPPAICNASQMNAAIREGGVGIDVLLHTEMTSEARADKTLVLREVDPGNRIELNFRAAPLNDLMVQELRDCELLPYTTEGEIPVPHEEGDTIDVTASLVGSRLVVTVDGVVVLSRDFPFADREGRVGVAVINEGSLSAFDSIWAQQL